MNTAPHAETSARTTPASMEIQAVVYPAFCSPPPQPAFRQYPYPLHNSIVSQDMDTAVTEGANESLELRIAEEARKSFDAGRSRGFQEGTQNEREAQKEARNLQEKQQCEQLTMLMQKFNDESEHYLHAVEREVVDLALAIAARILRREAQMDPLLLTGAVRVALGQLAESTEVRLLVPAKEFELWEETIAHIPNLTVRAKVLQDEAMCSGDFIIETEVGSVDLGIRSQLGEIERGFFDRSGHSKLETVGRREAQSAETRE